MNHYINVHDYKSALKELEGADIIDKMNIGHRYSHLLIRHEPTKTIGLLIETGEYCRNNNIAFDIERILVILGNIDSEYLDEAIKLEKFCIEELRIDHKELRLLYIFHLSQRDEVGLIKYLTLQREHSDSEAILAILRNNNKIEAQIAFLSTIGEKYKSVTLALQHNRQEDAKNIAKSVSLYSKELAKELWMLIAEIFISERNYKKAIELLHESESLTTEDILPLFDSSIDIEDYKNEIYSSLNEYKINIENWNKEL